MGQLVKGPALSLQWLGSLLWCGFNSWPRNFHVPRVQPNKEKKKIQCYTHVLIQVLSVTMPCSLPVSASSAGALIPRPSAGARCLRQLQVCVLRVKSSRADFLLLLQQLEHKPWA